MNPAVNPCSAPTVPRYVVCTFHPMRFTFYEHGLETNDKRAAWEEAKRRIPACPKCTVLVIDRHTRAILWQSAPDLPPRYEVAAANPAYVYSIEDDNFPVDVLSVHRDKDGARSAFSDAIKETSDDLILLIDIFIDRTVIARSDDEICNRAMT